MCRLIGKAICKSRDPFTENFRFAGNGSSAATAEREKQNVRRGLRSRPDGFFEIVRKTAFCGSDSVFFIANGKNILLDPVFGKTPLVKSLLMSSRWRRFKSSMTCRLARHRDHCDEESITCGQVPNARFTGGLKMERAFKVGCERDAGGGLGFSSLLADETVKIYFCPSPMVQARAFDRTKGSEADSVRGRGGKTIISAAIRDTARHTGSRRNFPQSSIV